MVLDEAGLAEDAMMFLSRFDWDSLLCTTRLLSGLVRKWLQEKPRHLCLLRFIHKALYSVDDNRLVVNVAPGSDPRVFTDAHRPILYRCAVTELRIEPLFDEKIPAPLELRDGVCALTSGAFVNNLIFANLDFRKAGTAYSFHDLLLPLRAVRFISLDKCDLASGQLNDELLHMCKAKHAKALRALDTVVFEKHPIPENIKPSGKGQEQQALVQWKRSLVDVSPAAAVSFLSATRSFWTSQNALQLDCVQPAMPMQFLRRFIRACEEGLVAEVCYVDMGGDFADLPHEMEEWYGDFRTDVNSHGMGVTFLFPSLRFEAAVSYRYFMLARPTLADFMSGAGVDSRRRF
ncbi:hypothetical protein AAVH_18655 [Aphelenchoides avenae]|nr:hypothetical protein AAVH_18655 [Aphelenchus avenae]